MKSLFLMWIAAGALSAERHGRRGRRTAGRAHRQRQGDHRWLGAEHEQHRDRGESDHSDQHRQLVEMRSSVSN